VSRYERLSVLDRTFLDLERPNYHQHVGAVLVFEAGPLRLPKGGVDAERIRAYIGSRLHRVPRYRQKLAWIPIENHPVWVDDEDFNLFYHVRHASLPRPGSVRQLKRLAGRIMSQRLDRGKPLWEIWIIEGLEGNRFALISKTHHSMIDGIAGVDLMAVVMSADPESEVGAERRWIPEKPPSRLELGRRELTRRLTMPFSVVRGVAHAVCHPREVSEEIQKRVTALGSALTAATTPASYTPLNQPIGPHRRFDWTQFDLDTVKQVKNKLGGTVNDVVLTTVSGALGSFLERRGVTRRAQNDMDLRAMVPVSVRPRSDRGTTGNRIALWAATLPVAERDPRRRLAAVREITTHLKDSRQALGAEVLAAVSEWTVPTLLTLATRVAYRSRAANLLVTNVPGPQIPLYLLGAPVLETYPMLNLLINQSLGVGLFSYAGKIGWGFIADWDRMPDLHDFVLAIETAFDELCEAAEVKRPIPARHPEEAAAEVPVEAGEDLDEDLLIP
jgi:WS/DGAT/MGAT family acyltransferase